ncbi:MAG: D-tyrosyl-tRNA(Tyr) deacylase [Endomicrobium sp.]|jgi:D-tyrosyl-tRNA(Tyr) deacylase|nr:D-tyrosyl-tRNA(Tyr) deacylase [Endomicrobium sp.]
MKTVIQRVKKASVIIDAKEKREIAGGLVVLAAFGKNDTKEICLKVFDKIKKLRIFSNPEGKFDYSVEDVKGGLLIISQFTLYGDCKKGKRPDFTEAAPYEAGKKLYEEFLNIAKNSGLEIKSGEFGADMLVEIHNDGPVTIIVDSENI